MFGSRTGQHRLLGTALPTAPACSEGEFRFFFKTNDTDHLQSKPGSADSAASRRREVLKAINKPLGKAAEGSGGSGFTTCSYQHLELCFAVGAALHGSQDAHREGSLPHRHPLVTGGRKGQMTFIFLPFFNPQRAGGAELSALRLNCIVSNG